MVVEGGDSSGVKREEEEIENRLAGENGLETPDEVP